jgi:hypothetical protein
VQVLNSLVLKVIDSEGVRKVAELAKTCAGYLIVPLLAATLAAFYSAWIIEYVFGPKYDEAIFMMRVLCPIVLAQRLQNLAFDSLNASEQHSVRLVVSVSAIHRVLDHRAAGMDPRGQWCADRDPVRRVSDRDRSLGYAAVAGVGGYCARIGDGKG